MESMKYYFSMLFVLSMLKAHLENYMKNIQNM